MNTEFARLLTSDGLELVGLFFTPEFGVSETTVIHVHGLAGNFYENRFIDSVTRTVIGQGLNFMAFNNRGHDYISDSIHIAHDGGEIGYELIGGAYERFADSRFYIEAYMTYARSKGSAKFILMGHSHGALKVAYYLGSTENPEITGCILLSPSDDFSLQRQRIGDKFDEVLKGAETFVNSGRENDWMPPDIFPYPISAGSYHDTFRSDSPLKICNLSGTERDDFTELARITVPVLGIVGTVQESFIGAPEDFLDALGSKLVNAESYEGHKVVGAPHNYMLHEEELADILEDWLNSKFIRNDV